MMFFKTSEELDSYYPVRAECAADVPKTRFKARVGKTLSPRRWNAAFTEDGHLDIAAVLRRIQRGGVHPTIKGVVWEFLLGCFDPNSTYDERNDIRRRRRGQYDALKAVCHNMVPTIGSGKFITTPIVTDDGHPVPDPQNSTYAISNSGQLDQREIQWMLSLPQIGLDVVRTDRTLVFYENEANQAKLWDVLAVYAWMDKDIGYVQGMNDICSPMVILIEHEADAFWCFERAMRRLRENFRCTTSAMGVQSQLGTLSQIIRAIDPKLHQHLEELDGGEYLFAIRMLMVLFRREFSFVDAMYLWEVMWAMEYNPNIFTFYEESMDLSSSNSQGDLKVNHKKMLKQYGKFERKNMQTGWTDQRGALAVFLVASVLEKKNKRLLREAQGMDDVVQILGEITGNLDAKKALKEALSIHKKYLSKASFTLLSLPSLLILYKKSILKSDCFLFECSPRSRPKCYREASCPSNYFFSILFSVSSNSFWSSLPHIFFSFSHTVDFTKY
ncbi:rab GTPase-activating protein 22-like isoform X2 [Salvia miltiorrhiza]|uniref:rab GTPase-activating protein 22-like isoform X2 n=1 Tax=Salvia miltiorrhiza TaxID=226208 RepID=UPI0025AD530A|nr:rab GTPase-activating protein 22-like isoform X2 [Salvia miltiorrhiza]